MKNVSGHFRLRDWPRVPKRQRRAVVVLILCAAFFLASVSAVTVLLIWDHQQSLLTLLWETTRQEQTAPDVPEAFSGGTLPEGADAGQGYLDETLWLGDSNTVRMYAYGLVPLENHMAQEGMGIEGVAQFGGIRFENDGRSYPILQAAALVQPRRIVMSFGTNDATGQFTQEDFIGMYRETVEALQEACPQTDIIINAIPPIGKRCSYPDIQMETIDAWNTALEALAREMDLPFLNSAEALKGKDGFARSDYVVEDGLHLNQTALEAVLEYARTHPYETEDRRSGTQRAPRRAA